GIISIDYVTGDFKFKGKKYKVAARNELLPYLYFDPQLVMIKFAEAHDTPAFQKTKGEMRTYFVGDTVQLRKHQFIIKEVSPLLENITIQRLGKTKE
ncbi:hypothetical protein OCK74_19640, partial [Chitinophagaceae bacterium LB-8]